MKKTGKAYASRKPEAARPENDFYPTPACMVTELINAETEEGPVFNVSRSADIYDPCCGRYAIGNILRANGYNNIMERDILYGQDFLKEPARERHGIIIMNPPFKLFNDFVSKAKQEAEKVFCIGKLNFFGAHDRNATGLWDNMEWVLPFDRQIAFDRPEHDGKVEMGMMVTGWFVWNAYYDGYPKIKVLDMQRYAWHKKMQA